jgi:uncharacterized protein (DUF952 family)
VSADTGPADTRPADARRDGGRRLTFHLVAGEYYRDCDSSEPYVPVDFAREGFIHCTDGAQNVADTANRYYQNDRRMYVALVIDLDRVSAEVRYEDKAGIYPHIYGPLNRDAIVTILPMLRGAGGAFLAPNYPGDAPGSA